MSHSTEEQLLSFFLYSIFIYPVTNYLVSPNRKYGRTQGVVMAIVFLGTISTIQLMHENRDIGPNHYALLNINRGSSIAALKKSYRTLSLELHPDKNKSPDAVEQFRKVNQAFDILIDRDNRNIYDRLGDAGVKAAATSVIDHKYIIIQMIVYYASSLILLFLMTFSEPDGQAMSASLFCLTVTLLFEMIFVLAAVPFPTWLMPYHTVHEAVSLMHRIFPVAMGGIRCIIGSNIVDKKATRVNELNELSASMKSLSSTAFGIVIKEYDRFSDRLAHIRMRRSVRQQLLDKRLKESSNDAETNDDNSDDEYDDDENEGEASGMYLSSDVAVAYDGMMARALKMAQHRCESSVVRSVRTTEKLLKDPTTLYAASQEKKRTNRYFEMARDLAIFLVVRWAIQKGQEELTDSKQK